jgi:hypothetical protein
MKSDLYHARMTNETAYSEYINIGHGDGVKMAEKSAHLLFSDTRACA